jgi:acetylornithine deacetylase/succinyl-diaminopimelate desuccinylase-like protein
VNNAALPHPDLLLEKLRLLCAQPSVSGQARSLAEGADAVTAILRDVGLDCSMIQTDGAPIVIGRYDAGAPRTLLVYGRYDVPSAGLRRHWVSDPFTPTLRDDALYARGAVIKGELVARAVAIKTLIDQRVPLNIVVVVEGDSLSGSPYLSQIRDSLGTCDLCLWSGGSFDAENVPLMYSGVKGLLQVELRVAGLDVTVPATYAATVPNPIWTLVLVLASLKSEYEEILIEGFYDEIEPPSRAELNTVQGLDVGEQDRKAAWGVEQFLANVSGAMLARTETFSPGLNISALNVVGGNLSAIPPRASLELHFQLVPSLQPASLFDLLVSHIKARGFSGVEVRQIPGAYGPFQSKQLPFDPAAAATSIYGRSSRVLPLTPFPAPAGLLLDQSPLISCGLERPDSALFGPNERVRMHDLINHTRLIIELITRMAV